MKKNYSKPALFAETLKPVSILSATCYVKIKPFNDHMADDGCDYNGDDPDDAAFWYTDEVPGSNYIVFNPDIAMLGCNMTPKERDEYQGIGACYNTPSDSSMVFAS
jgi:hypothetical protein